MKEISLTQGFVATVDDEDYEHLSQWKWQYKANRSVGGYARRVERGIPIFMHWVVMGASEGQKIDHTDRNGLNNCRSNLRFATTLENSRNQSPHFGLKSKTSQYKGVSKHRNRWVAMLMSGKKVVYWGSFETETEAARAYDKAAKEHFGSFAYLNFPDE